MQQQGKVYGAHMPEQYDGSQMMRVGATAEEAWLDWAGKHTRDMWEVKDYRLNKSAQSRKIDFVLWSKEDRSRWIAFDIKSDRRIGVTDKLLVEVQRDYHDQPNPVEGWLLKSEAHYLVYYNPDTRKAFYFQMQELREYYRHHEAELRPKWIKIASDARKTTWCVLLPISAFRVLTYDLGG